MHMGLAANRLTPPGSPHQDSISQLQPVLRFAPDHVSLPKNKSTSNLLAQESAAPLSVNTKRMSIDAGQLDRMARWVGGKSIRTRIHSDDTESIPQRIGMP